MAGHDGYFGARQKNLDLAKQLNPAESRKLEIGEDKVGDFPVQERQCGLGAFRLGTRKSERIADGHA